MSLTRFFRRSTLAVAGAAALGLMSSQASASLTITPITSTVGITDTLTAALLAPGSGISVVGGSATYQGVNTSTFQQSGLYSNFNLAPSSGSSPTLTMNNGIVLTSGNVNFPMTNTVNNFRGTPGSGGNAQLTGLSGTPTNDANVLSFNFTVAPGVNSVSAQFMFGTEEFPTQTVTDIFGFFVDGVNYAKFSNGQLISNTPGNPTNFISNPLGSGLYGIEYNGLTQVFTVTGLLDSALSTHTITIGLADTSDSIFDSGVFVSGLKAGEAGGCSGIGCNTVPEPGSLALSALALLGIAGIQKRRRQK